MTSVATLVVKLAVGSAFSSALVKKDITQSACGVGGTNGGLGLLIWDCQEW